MDSELRAEVIENVVKDVQKAYGDELRERIFRFVVNILKFLMKIPRQTAVDVLINQLSKSATAIGANFEEAQSTTEREFTQKLRIALREANETKYWLRIIQEIHLGNHNEVKELSQEAGELALILGSIVSKMDKRLRSKK